MARSVDPLVVGRVIGDVLDMFTPSADMLVYYGSRHVTNGCDVKPSLTVEPPTVRISDRGPLPQQSPSLFTLVMTDPDAPSPSEPSMREWLHWIVTDIPAGGVASQGCEIVAYNGPKPPIGIHRYVLVAFRQEQGLMKHYMIPPPARHLFSTRTFASHYNLGLPVAAVYFNAQKEPANKKR